VASRPARGSDVAMVMADGRVVMKDERLADTRCLSTSMPGCHMGWWCLTWIRLDKMPPGLKQEPHATRKLVLCAGCAPQ
jgi:hypothetical protein